MTHDENQELARFLDKLPKNRGRQLLETFIRETTESQSKAARAVDVLLPAFSAARAIMLRAITTKSFRLKDARAWIKEHTDGSTNL